MNILFLNSARGWGGNEQWTHLAASGLSKENHVYLAYRKEEIGSRFAVARVKLPFLNDIDPITISRLIHRIKRDRIDLLVPTKRKDYLLAGIAARCSGAKNVIRLGIVRELRDNWINSLIYDKLCDGIIVNARAIEEALLRSSFIDPGKVKVIYNGIDLVGLEEKACELVNFTKPFPFLVASSGIISERKGFDLLLKGFSLFKERNTSYGGCGLMILGSGPQMAQLEKLTCRLKLEESVIFTGFQSNPFPYIRECDLFILASSNEGISNALLEAMALRKPVISTYSGGVQEVIEDGRNGLLWKKGDVESLADLLTVMYDDRKKRDQIADAAFHTVSERSVEGMTGELIGFFHTILAKT